MLPSLNCAMPYHRNPALSALGLSWGWAEFSAEDGLGVLGLMFEAGDALVAIARSDEDGMTIIGSGVMVAPGILLTATHVLQEFAPSSAGPFFLTFQPGFPSVVLGPFAVVLLQITIFGTKHGCSRAATCARHDLK